MKERHLPIEQHFFRILLKISTLGTATLVILELIQSQSLFQLSVLIDLLIFLAVLLSYFFFNRGYFTVSALMLSLFVIVAMAFESLSTDYLKPGTLVVYLVVGLSNALLFKAKVKKVMQTLTFLIMVGLFVNLLFNYYSKDWDQLFFVLNVGATYILIYLIIAYATGVLKGKYDAAMIELSDTNRELVDANHEIQAQNEELVQSQCNLYELNMNLEKLVEDKTRQIREQNRRLIQYSYNNAHHLRGPVARLQGLVDISGIDPKIDQSSLLDMIKKQALEIDNVVKQINEELDLNEDLMKDGDNREGLVEN